MGATGAPETDLDDGMLAEMRITVARAQGGREHMEDRHHVEVVRDTNNHLLYVFAAVYDGHGGDEASKYARKHLHINIMKDPLFDSDNDDDVLQAIRNGFIRTHHEMKHYIKDDSTAGTTATCAIFREGKLFFGHVGDSAIIRVSSQGTGKMLTTEHKPDLERDRVEALGGTVMCKGGTWRVARKVSNPATGEFMADVPKLNMSRALGDFWSRNPTTGEYAVKFSHLRSMRRITRSSFSKSPQLFGKKPTLPLIILPSFALNLRPARHSEALKEVLRSTPQIFSYQKQ